MKIVVAGGGAAGLFAALLLARSGHEAVVLEADRLAPAPDVESAAAAAFRPAAPQIVQPHLVMARGRELLRQRLPDVYDGLLAAGVAEAPLATQMPASLPDKEARAGDERFTMLETRRSTLDWVLLRAALAEPRVTLRGGTRVTGLVASGTRRPPHVTGVRTDRGDVAADLVVDATGRRSPADRWLRSIGARPSATWQAECGVAYYSRHYRVRPGLELPGPAMLRTVAGLDEFTVGIWPADNGAMQLAVAPLAADRRFRTVKDPAVFTAVLRTVPVFSAWLDVLDPITGVFPMGGLHNTLRRLVSGGSPVVTGLHAIGDVVCTTNPTLGRGLSLALTGAVGLADCVESHGEDWTAQALALDDQVARHVAPFYEDQAVIDQARLAALRHAIFGAPAPDSGPGIAGRVTYAQLRTAAAFDATAFRAFWKIMGMLCAPAEVYTDPRIVTRTQEVLEQRGSGAPIAQPAREALLTALRAGLSGSGGPSMTMDASGRAAARAEARRLAPAAARDDRRLHRGWLPDRRDQRATSRTRHPRELLPDFLADKPAGSGFLRFLFSSCRPTNRRTTSTCCPGPTARCVRRRAAREALFRNKRRSANVGDTEVDA